MEFLTLFFIYVLSILTCLALVCKYSGKGQFPLEKLFVYLTNVISHLVPERLQTVSNQILHRLFHKRNSFFLTLHFLLEAAVYGEFTYEIFGYCQEIGFSLPSLIVPYVLLTVKMYFFSQCCTKDPGTITKLNNEVFLGVYPYDQVMFYQGVLCPTCVLVKPARSKHCRVCNVCVHRFDHHCVWVNNCIGAFNTKYFLLYLMTLSAMAADIAVLTIGLLLHLVLQSNLMSAAYVDEEGHQQPVGLFFVIQYLFLTFPRIVFMLGFLMFLFLLLLGYSFFHLYLAVTNQTANEWYKRKSHGCQHCNPSPLQQQSHTSLHNFYSRGTFRNLKEILKPITKNEKKGR
ncbi:palmitoyltransferase ZDHHC4 [Acipenser ruthenus]|uniref:palmitoyltransferase ZDHHC4 n=1 Tax=Acipenser ruthenus TaxID=7906 RepID=UPI00145BCC52|nr:palmitoyltransferase ZDHHC4 [Acipenser ruthenus]XP_033886672.3 palmitoyltransferase ZDHHC4 [Acipenser ruthenus]XP_033886673.3 palmitoyltransferase ZDHHC4 [Acipenser ruthenus]XP_033886676.3 palmitoyltransferase ZDHHC4 [Acipenser ruthenus]XP_058891481.1 palmitoyltransferase ZDHHC4 [Acipenser ruthenus]